MRVRITFGCPMLKLSDAGLAVVTAVTGRLPLRLRSAFLLELAAAFAGHEGEGLHKLAVEAAKRGRSNKRKHPSSRRSGSTSGRSDRGVYTSRR
jgi:hypothetical protein